jgi:hypothetical protein
MFDDLKFISLREGLEIAFRLKVNWNANETDPPKIVQGGHRDVSKCRK